MSSLGDRLAPRTARNQGRPIIERGIAAPWVIPAFEELEDREPGFRDPPPASCARLAPEAGWRGRPRAGHLAGFRHVDFASQRHSSQTLQQLQCQATPIREITGLT